jgi:SAM-dependent methyltransferase
MATIDISAPAERNKQPILEVLQKFLPLQGRALEIASGTGQHLEWFAKHLREWHWQPSDFDASSLPGIAARIEAEGLQNVAPPVVLDVLAQDWLAQLDKQAQRFDLIYCANMLHISPWATCAGLMQGAAKHLNPLGQLVTYGPFLEDGVPTSEGNRSFDKSLQSRNPAWGIRRREDVELVAERFGLSLAERHAMPANNLLLVWARR